eukprot:TRINITY_DN14298_c0_g1_i4.p2 TRINITY_DN14298_c0_g1~~TRINITY_DN14298_c0_g1_i4.p2  ORF type:complete len:182 (-),score=39.15 TRINITY_DN14298_c0_g1_i4:36-581(-)
MANEMSENISDDEAPEEVPLSQVKQKALHQLQQEQSSQKQQYKRKRKRNLRDSTLLKNQDIQQDQQLPEQEDQEEELLPEGVLNQLLQERQQQEEQQQKFDKELKRSQLIVAKRQKFDEVDKGVVKVRVLKPSQQQPKPAEKANEFKRLTLFGGGKKRSYQMLNKKGYNPAMIFKKMKQKY